MLMFEFAACAAHAALQILAVAAGHGCDLRLVWTAHPSGLKFME